MEKKKHTVVCQKWEESERGWGARPDGCSLHLSQHCLVVFIDKYWRSMPDAIPDEYERPCGSSYMCEVDGDIYNKIKESEHGIRCGDCPGS